MKQESLEALGAIPVNSVREKAGDVLVAMARVVADNPGQTAVAIAGTVVITRAAANLVRPRTPFQALCLLIVLELGIPQLVRQAGERGWMQWYGRDSDGNKIPVFVKEHDAGTVDARGIPAEKI